jgi:translation initiation factor 1
VSKNKKQKIISDKDISLGEAATFSLSIGEALGKPGASAESDVLPDIESFMASVSQATLHRETSGRGGKTVTLLGMTPAPDKKTAEALAKAMRKALGCGSHVEGARIVLQGDNRERAEAWLVKCGVRKIAMGN